MDEPGAAGAAHESAAVGGRTKVVPATRLLARRVAGSSTRMARKAADSGTRVARQAADSGTRMAQQAADSGTRMARQAAGSGAGMARRAARRAAGVPGLLRERLPEGVRDEVAQSIARLKKVRSFRGAKKAFVEEAERLFLAVTPLLAAAPLPVEGWQARVAAGTAGGAGAAVEQAEEIAGLVSWGGAVPSAPAVAAAVFSAWLLELWIALSARVHQLRAAGRDVDPEVLGRELALAYLGDAGPSRRDGSASIVRAVAVRAAERWAAGLVPGVGIAFDSYASQRTVARILRQPLTAHPHKA